MPSSAPGSRKFIGAVHDDWRMFSDNPDDYDIGLPIGYGATSIVYAAKYIPKDGSSPYPCAVKVVNLDKLPQQSLRLLRRETQLMSLSKHPNVLRVRGSWMTGHNLYIALRLMNAGSAADVMHYGSPGGMEEEVVKCILKQALEGLNYLHINGFIHRDVKAANLLIDDDGTVLLGDLGVSASLSDDEPVPTPSVLGQRLNFNRAGNGDDSQIPLQATTSKKKIGKRKSFVGTPCWMAPELISGKQYDAKADIWSFGITAIELTQGRAPRSREAPSRVLLKTVQDAPPSFARESGQYKFTRSFKEIVESCLVKDPARRPRAAELLETSFFKSAKRKNYLVNTILRDLPPLVHRQERRPKASPLDTRDRTSISSWDFSIELPHLPEGRSRSQYGSANPTYLNPTISHHSFFNSHSQHTTVALPGPTRLDALEEHGYTEHFEKAKAARPTLGLTGVDAEAETNADTEDAADSHSSVDTSIFELDEGESNPTTPELLSVSVAGSSVATTPLSCSPAAVLDMPQPKTNTTMPMSSSPPPSGASINKTTTVRQKNAKTQHVASQRRVSSPVSALTSVTKLGSVPSLKRIGSASGFSGSRTSSSSSPGETPTPSTADAAKRPDVPASPLRTPTVKGSRWKKLLRAGNINAGANTGTNAEEASPRRSTLGRILERSGK